MTFATNAGGGSLTASGGTNTGNPIVLGATTLDPSGSGSGTFHFMGDSATLGSNIGAGYTVWASGIPNLDHGLLTENASVTNAGTLELGSIDHTHGTLSITSGTFTNDGSVIFEEVQNGNDGLNGNFVNNGTVTVDNPVSGGAVITNNGTFTLAPGQQFGATSFAQGSAGTLALQITGGGSPLLPQLQLSGSAALAGKLAVTTSTTETGTVPVIEAGSLTGKFASTSYTGENYSAAYSATGLNLTGPAAATATTASKPAVGKVKITNGKLTIALSCHAASACSTVKVVAQITERLKGKKVVAVAASTSAAKVSSKKLVVIASGSATVAAGKTKTLTLTLNHAGKALLAKFHRLKAAYVVTIDGKKLKSGTVTFTVAKKTK